MRRYDLVEPLGIVVMREPYVLHLAVGLQLLHEIPHSELVEHGRARAPRIVDEVEVEVPRPRLLEPDVEVGLRLGGVLGLDPGCVLRGKLEALARIPLDERLTDGRFRTCVGARRVVIRATRLHEQVHHLLHLLDVDRFVIELRKPHQAKTKFGNAFT